MPQRLAGTFGLVAFAVCIVLGLRAGNEFASVLGRAIGALFACLVVGLIVGTMWQKMLEENLKAEAEKLKNDSGSAAPSGR